MSRENIRCDRVNRIAGAPHVLIWGIMGFCAIAATVYDISQWVMSW